MNSSSKGNIASNPPKKIQNIEGKNVDIPLDFGKKYIDVDIDPAQKKNEEKDKNDINNNINIDNEIHQKEIKALAYNYLNDLSQKKPKNIVEENLKKSLRKIGINNIDPSNNSNPFTVDDDEMEIDLDNQIKVQEIRNKRRLFESTMFFLKPEENYVNDNFKLSNINYMVNDPFLTKSIMYLLPKDKEKENIEAKFKENELRKYIEDLHPGSRLEISNIIKKYENKGAYILNNLSFNMYENEIFALLGQNGAGKSTFISILSGLIEANSGNIKFIDKENDIEIEALDPKGYLEFRKILGICYQNNNILYDNLTVKENLEIFCLLKYDKKNDKESIQKEVQKLIEDFELQKEENNLAKNLSGGYKRRLCIAIAFCGRSKVIILDEPTGGIDILDTKKLWKIIKKLKNDNKIILLISHFMEEVSFLADKIGVLKNGKLLYEGTRRQLIDKYGNYITIQINKRPDKNIQKLVQYINDNIILKDINNSNSSNEILVNNNNQNSSSNSLIETKNMSYINNNKMELKRYKERISIKIHVKDFDFSKTNELLYNIESIYKINDYRILRDQLEDVFINTIDKNMDKDEKDDYKDLSEVDKHIDKQHTCYAKFKKELKILVFKRFYETIRDKQSFILEIIFPILLTLIGCLVSYIEFLENNRTSPIELNNLYNDTQTIYYDYQSRDKNIFDYQMFLIPEIKNVNKQFKNIDFILLPNYLGNKEYTLLQNIVTYLNTVYEYNKKEKIFNNSAYYYSINEDKINHKYEFITYISTRQRHSPIVFTNFFLHNIITNEINNYGNYIEYLDKVVITNSPFPLTYEEKNDKKGRNGFSLVLYISIALALIPSNFITIIIREKENKSKHLQILSGLSIYTYWINNYIFELIKYYVVVGICMAIITSFNFYEKYLVIFYFFYGPALVSFTYVISYFINSEGSGQIIVLLINLIFGALSGSAVLLLRTNEKLKRLGIVLSYIFRFIPSFCICYGFNQLISKKMLFTFDYFKDDYENFKKIYNDSSFIIKDSKYIINDIIFLVLEIFIYTGLLIFLEKKDYFLWRLGCLKNKYQKYYIDLDKNPNPGEINKEEVEIGSSGRRIDPKEKIYPLKVYKL